MNEPGVALPLTVTVSPGETVFLSPVSMDIETYNIYKVKAVHLPRQRLSKKNNSSRLRARFGSKIRMQDFLVQRRMIWNWGPLLLEGLLKICDIRSGGLR